MTIKIALLALCTASLAPVSHAQAPSRPSQQEAVTFVVNSVEGTPQFRWDRKGNTIRSILNLGYVVPTEFQDSPVTAAAQVLSHLSSPLGITDVSRDLEYSQTNDPGTGRVAVKFKQVRNGVKVRGGGFTVGYATARSGQFEQGTVTFIMGHFFAGEVIDPLIFPDEARQLALAYFGDSIDLASKPESVLYPSDPDDGLSPLRPSYEFLVGGAYGESAGTITVDGVTGDTFESHSRGTAEQSSSNAGERDRPVSFHGDGIVGNSSGADADTASYFDSCNSYSPCAFVYVTDPDEASYNVGYEKIFRTSSGCLDGTYVKTVQGDLSGATTCENSSGDYYYSAGTQERDDASAYYHVDMFGRGNLRLDLDHQEQVVVVTRADIDRPGEVNSTCSYLKLAPPDSQTPSLNPAFAGALIIHEYIHVIVGRYEESLCNSPGYWPAAVAEALSDYYGILYRILGGGSSTVMGSYIGTWNEATDWSRDIDNDFNYFDIPYDFDGVGSANSEYDRSLVLSGALWDFVNIDTYGYKRAINESLANISVDADFDDVYDAIKATARCEFHDCYADLKLTFGAHGLGEAPIGYDPRRRGEPEVSIVMMDDASHHLDRTASHSSVTPTISAYPNPFNPYVIVSVSLPIAVEVQIRICDVLGRVVASLSTGQIDAGVHEFKWDASGFPNGLYWAAVTSRTGRQSIPLLLAK